ncbi:MAG: VapE domain-containing protein [Prevotella sp.]
MERMTKDDSKNTVGTFRDFVSMAQDHYGHGRRWTGDYYLMHQMPSFLPSLDIYNDKQGNETMRAFNGIVTLSVDHIDEETDLEAVKRVAAMMPMTLAAFIGSTGTTVKILVKVEPKDGHAITTEEEAEQFCALSYDIVVKMYDAVINHNVQMAASAREGNCLYAGFRLPLDPKPYYNPKASAIRIETVAQGKPLQVTQPINDRQLTGEDGFQSESDSDIRQMLEFLKTRYEFRYNMLERVPEMKILTKPNYGWLPLDAQRFNSILLDLQSSGLRIWDKDFNRYLNSQKITIYDPVQDYLYDLKHRWDGNDHIGRLADCVPTDCPHWKLWFRKWFIGMVAQWMEHNRRYGNSVAPLLISRQGYNKSTFCRRLLPPQFKQTFIDNLDVAEKKATLIAMAQSLLINLDEFNAIAPRIQQGFLKNIMQLPAVKVKLPYARSIETLPRRASFIATTNMTDILADPSGSRRFIGVELTAPIDVTTSINYDQLYAQAIDAIYKGERYWFDQQETAELIAHNRKYQLLSPAEHYFRLCFEVCHDLSEGEYMSAAAIFQRIKQVAGSSLGISAVTKFGQFLTNIEGIVRKRTNSGMVYLVKQIHKQA